MMNIILKIIFIVSLIFFIASCTSMTDKKLAKEEKKNVKFEEKVKIDTDKVIEKGIQSVEETRKLGPQPPPEGKNVKRERRTVIKEETPIYSQSSISPMEETFLITLNLDNVEVDAAMRMIGDLIDKNILVGEGAGGDPTATSVVSDIINLSVISINS